MYKSFQCQIARHFLSGGKGKSLYISFVRPVHLLRKLKMSQVTAVFVFTIYCLKGMVY